jgi:glycosyltransferase involved in cell wall biosynthesis
MQKQHFVFLNQYYPPDMAPTGVMLRDVAEEMVAQGNRVTIICSRGGYSGGENELPIPGGSDEIRVIRVPTFRFGRNSALGKLCDYASFYFLAFWFGLTAKGGPTCYVALTTPPYLSVLVRLVSKLRRAKHAHWVMDLYPDVMVAHGLLKENSWTTTCLLAISRWGFGGSRNHKTVSLGPDMADRLLRRHGVENGVWIPLWSSAVTDDSAEENSHLLRKDRGWDGKTVFLYSGNMGLGHRLDDFLTLAKENQNNRKLVFAFYGGGRRKKEVEDFLKENPESVVEVGGYVPEELLAAHLLSADVHLASLEPSWDGCMVPSKIQGIFASARPVIFVGSDSCAIGRWIREANAGWIVSPGDHLGAKSGFSEALEASIRTEKGKGGCLYSEKLFHRSKNKAKTCREFQSKV